jgi:hypothetical protein
MAVVAELKGKLNGFQWAGVPYVEAEDPLTSSVFETIEVMDRELGLGKVLKEATDDAFSSRQLVEAKFDYWPRDQKAFGDRTEPDLIITVGDTLFLLEAKYHSGLGKGDNDDKDQIKREYRGGMALVKHESTLSRFRLICVVGDVSVLDDIARFRDQTGHDVDTLQWQQIHRIMAEIEELPDIDWRDRILATRCKELLESRRMASFRGFQHLEAYRQAEGFYGEVFTFANMLLGRLNKEGVVRAVEEFRIEKDGGQRSLAVGGLDQWAPSYFALPVQRSDERGFAVKEADQGRTRFYNVDRFAFFMVDVDAKKVVVGKATAKPRTEKSARFWDLFFRSFKKSWSEKMTTIKVGPTEFGLELKVIEPDQPDLLETVTQTISEYLS